MGYSWCSFIKVFFRLQKQGLSVKKTRLSDQNYLAVDNGGCTEEEYTSYPELVGLTLPIAGLYYINNILERYHYSFTFLLVYYYSVGFSLVFIKKNPNRGKEWLTRYLWTLFIVVSNALHADIRTMRYFFKHSQKKTFSSQKIARNLGI